MDKFKIKILLICNVCITISVCLLLWFIFESKMAYFIVIMCGVVSFAGNFPIFLSFSVKLYGKKINAQVYGIVF